MLDERRIAVIAGIGEVVDRSRDPNMVDEPVGLITRALDAAAADAGDGWLQRIDSVELVALSSWRYKNPVADVCARLHISPQHQINSRRGGETPIRLLHEAALKVTNGTNRACAIVGGEATNARQKARRLGVRLGWTPMPSPQETVEFPGLSSSRMPLAERYGMTNPSRIYPLYETASQAEWGQSPGEAHRRSADLWAQYAHVAQDNPFAWIRSAPNKEMIGTPSPDNRLINWPYTKLMVANPSVNLASAFIVTSLAEARAAAIPDEELIFIIGGAAANECDHFLERDSFRYSRAQEAVLERVTEIAGGSQAIAHMELYSCFPVVPKMAQRTLGKDAYDRSPTVTGGLTFFGAPLHNYMSHAVCAMVRALRSDGEGVGLLYGQGGHMTKHHAVILSRTPPQNELSAEFSVQSTADARRAPAPLIRSDYGGPADVEAYTVHYDRDGRPIQGVVILLTPAGERTIARVPIEDAETLAVLESSTQSAVGQAGQVSIAADGDATWRANATHLKEQAA